METDGTFRQEGKEERPDYGHGYRWEGDDPELLAFAVDAAFDYRGDVTLLLRDGGELQGYLANRDRTGPEPFLLLLPPDGSASLRVLYRSLRGIAFSGRDTASGKSWESWVRRYEEKKRARERGEKVDDPGLFPEAPEGGA